MQAHEDAVTGQAEVLLHVIGTLRERELVGLAGVLGCVGRRATVGDTERRRRPGRSTGAQGDDEQENSGGNAHDDNLRPEGNTPMSG